MIFQKQITVPEALRSMLHRLHDEQGRDTSCEQSVRGGTQISLLADRSATMSDFLNQACGAIGAMLPQTPFRFVGLWSIRMGAGGHHVPHNHPQGWMSGVCYLDVPDTDSALLQFDGAGVEVKPKDGMMVLFPSFLVHGTTAYAGDKPRLTVAFDLERA